MGKDPCHPESTSREIAALAPDAPLVVRWKDPEGDETVPTVLAFLEAHTPG